MCIVVLRLNAVSLYCIGPRGIARSCPFIDQRDRHSANQASPYGRDRRLSDDYYVYYLFMVAGEALCPTILKRRNYTGA
jgi:hypothetical protein